MHRTIRKTALGLVALVLALSVLTGCLSADQDANVTLINKTRSSYRKAQLKTHSAAMSKAQAWSERMAKTGKLEHTGGGDKVDPSGLRGWCRYGENVGYGPSVQWVHDAFVKSQQHLSNMIGDFNVVGTGVVLKGRTYWVTEIYLKTC